MDIVVDYASRGLQARNKCACFAHPGVPVPDPVPGEFMTREGTLPFVAEGNAYLRGGALFLTRMCNLDLFDSEAAMHAPRTHPQIYLNKIIMTDSRFIPAKQFLGTS